MMETSFLRKYRLGDRLCETGVPIEVKQYPGFYYIPHFINYGISVEGIVKNIQTGIDLPSFITKPSEKKKDTGGYVGFSLYSDFGNSMRMGRHRLLCLTFKIPPETEEKLVVNHKNGKPGNDHLDNLEWCTYSENNQHAYDTGLRPYMRRVYYKATLKSEPIECWNREEAAEISGVGAKTVWYRLKHSEGNVYTNGGGFSYSVDGPWYHDDNPSRQTREKVPVISRNVFTGEVVKSGSYKEAAKLSDVSYYTIRDVCNATRITPVNDWCHQHDTDEVEWANFNDRHLEIFKNSIGSKASGVVATDIESGEEYFFANTQLLEEGLGIKQINVSTLIKGKVKTKAFNGKRYLLSRYKTTDHLGPPIK